MFIPSAINKAPETRGGINEKTVSICIDPYQRKIPTDSRTDSPKAFWYHKRGTGKVMSKFSAGEKIL